MKSYDLLELAVRNLRQSKLRNGLTTVGISVGVASLVAMLSLGVGLQQLATRRLAGSGLFDTVFVTSRQDFRGFDKEDDAKAPNPEKSPVLDEAARAKITQLPNVTEVEPEIRVMGEIMANGETHFGFVTGLPMSARENEAFESLKGKFFSSDNADEAILLNDFAKELDPKNPADLIGKTVTLRYGERQALAQDSSDQPRLGSWQQHCGRRRRLRLLGGAQAAKLRVVGTHRPRALWRHADGFAWAYLPSGRTTERLNMAQFTDMRSSLRGASGKTYMTLTVRVKDPGKVQAVQDAVNQMGFRTFSVLDATKSLRRFFTVLDLFLGIFGSLALAVATLAIINTLVMAVLERRREIGVMKAIGASDQDVKKLFFTEAGAMGLFGGVLGILLGFAIGKAINFGTGVYLHSRQLPASRSGSCRRGSWALPSLFSIVVSLLAGLYPASRAAKLDPVQTLKYE